MIIGVDLDNTIVSQDELFYDVALEMGLITPGVAKSKIAVRESVQAGHANDAWTVLQSYVYGRRLHAARAFPGVAGFFRSCRAHGVPLYIVSHKTQRAAKGDQYDLHGAAMGWLDAQGFFSDPAIALDRQRIYFASTRTEKIDRIAQLGCTHFVDDLPEVFAEPSFPRQVNRILFDPADAHTGWRDGVRARTWADIRAILESHAVQLG